MRRLSINGVRYAAREWGAGPALLLLHGFTGCAARWEAYAARWSAQFHVVAVDLLGHGDSDAPTNPSRYAMAHCVADLAALLDTLGVTRSALLGYSMGGRVALAFAVAHAKRVSALVLESASAGIDDPAERAARAVDDAALAARIERDGVAAFVDAWMAQPLFATQTGLGAAVLAAARAQRLATSAPGLANALRGLGSGTQPSYWEQLDRLTMPVLLLTGERDAKFCDLASAMQTRIPGARCHIVPAAGHTTHLENPDAFAAAVHAFLQRAAGSATPAQMDAHS